MASQQYPNVEQTAQPAVIRRVISGRITVEGSERGVPNLVVEALNVVSKAETRRIGSASTDSAGTFRIEIATSADAQDGEWNLQAVVLAPERANRARKGRQLYESDVRERAGYAEFFRIELSVRALKQVDIDAPTAANAAASAAAGAITATQTHAEQIRAATDKVFTTRYDTVAERKTLYRTDVSEFLTAELSTVSDDERASDRFVPDDIRIEAVHRAAVVKDVGTLMETTPDPVTGAAVPKVRLPGRFQLTLEQRKKLIPDGTPPNQPVVLTEAEVEQRLGVSLDKPPTIYRRHLEPDPCRPLTDAEKCLADNPDDTDDEDDDDQDAPDTDPPNGEVGGGNVQFRKGAAIARLMGRQSAPEDPVVFGPTGVNLEPSLHANEVSTAVNQVVFTPGPADVPSFHDFHDLQIAFEPVWQEALDDKYLKDVESAYDQIVEQGGAPAVDTVKKVVRDHRTGATSGRFFDHLFDNLFDISIAADVEVPGAVISAVMISLDEWRALPATSRSDLTALANRIATLREKLIEALDPDNIPDVDLFNIGEMIRAANTRESIAYRSQIQILAADAQRIVAHARRLLIEREAKEPFQPTHAIIEALRRRRSEAYPFRYFAANARSRSVNFGLMVTYRQKWTPVSYQVGELVSTVPLAPMESRKFSRKTVTKTTRSQKEIESNLISRRTESQETSRAEAEIVARATAKTNFTRSNVGTVNIGENAVGGSTTTTTTFTRDVEKHSQSVKREFREAILKTAEEYKNERKIEVSTEEIFEQEFTESGEIRNPNDEIPVTFLFYELEQRFKVCEQIFRLQSVVLVAQEVPTPSSIDVAWLIRYDWILNRVLLDDSFRPALTYASTTLISEDVALKEMREALFRQRSLVEDLKEDVADRRALSGLRYAALQRQIERTAKSADSGGGLFGGLGDLVGSIPIAGDIVQGGLDLLTGGGSGPSEAAQIREGASRDAFDREAREADEMASRLSNALASLDAMQRAYTERLAQHLRQLAQVERLIGHIVQNIMPYMQAIWAYEPDDQRFLRLRNVPVPVFEKLKAQRHYGIHPALADIFADRPTLAYRPVPVVTDFSILPPLTPQQPQFKTRPLSEVANINRPLGCMGNYLIFPMMEANPITEFMMDPYVTMAEGEYGVSDPDPLGNMTLDEFSEYVCCLRKHFDETGGSEPSPGEPTGGEPTGGQPGEPGEAAPVNPFDELKPYLRETLKKLLQLSLRNDDEVIVPSGNLYIEALPGAHSVMEQFKHLHRQIDVKIAQSRLRAAELDNIRRAQRIVDDLLEDPDIEAKYVFEGDGTATVVPPVGPGWRRHTPLIVVVVERSAGRAAMSNGIYTNAFDVTQHINLRDPEVLDTFRHLLDRRAEGSLTKRGASNMIKEEIGERQALDRLSRRFPRAQIVLATPRANGVPILDIILRTPDGRLIIVEAKFSSAGRIRYGRTNSRMWVQGQNGWRAIELKRVTVQMSPRWIEDRLIELAERGERRLAGELNIALRNGNFNAYTVVTDRTGEVLEVVDKTQELHRDFARRGVEFRPSSPATTNVPARSAAVGDRATSNRLAARSAASEAETVATRGASSAAAAGEAETAVIRGTAAAGEAEATAARQATSLVVREGGETAVRNVAIRGAARVVGRVLVAVITRVLMILDVVGIALLAFEVLGMIWDHFKEKAIDKAIEQGLRTNIPNEIEAAMKQHQEEIARHFARAWHTRGNKSAPFLYISPRMVVEGGYGKDGFAFVASVPVKSFENDLVSTQFISPERKDIVSSGPSYYNYQIRWSVANPLYTPFDIYHAFTEFFVEHVVDSWAMHYATGKRLPQVTVQQFHTTVSILAEISATLKFEPWFGFVPSRQAFVPGAVGVERWEALQKLSKTIDQQLVPSVQILEGQGLINTSTVRWDAYWSPVRSELDPRGEESLVPAMRRVGVDMKFLAAKDLEYERFETMEVRVKARKQLVMPVFGNSIETQKLLDLREFLQPVANRLPQSMMPALNMIELPAEAADTLVGQ